MKAGLAIIMGKAGPPKSGPPMPSDKSEPAMPDDEAAEGDDDAKQYAKLVIDALKDGDDEGAANALVSLVRGCK